MGNEMIFFNNFSKKYEGNNHIFWGSFDKKYTFTEQNKSYIFSSLCFVLYLSI